MNYLIRRFFAFYLDMIIISVLSIITFIIVQLFIGISLAQIKNPLEENLLSIQIIIYILYFTFSEFFFKRTIGKSILSLTVCGYEQFSKYKLYKYLLLRSLFKLIPLDPFSIFLNEDHRMWHDLVSKTTVVDVRKKK
jgi:uncharacterized RDD family membrane protein YckC